ncbi:adenine phosphoribosyltransferase [bacterium (Candidatus Torokbacteria) CG09_land_8_20_14_0_10_42_11]|nr:MAG: adenine phosphoribosyltransferase [bacterium (Candidatus Torokbacteria) CG09_land_8_20_14_0_10_42_11]
MDLTKYIRVIPDFPKKGISFKDITPLLENAQAYHYAIDKLAKPFQNKKIQKVVGIDARGFLLASAVAYKLKTGISIVRKKGKLPYHCLAESYSYEYSKDILEIHNDTIKPGEKVLIVDDILATGNTLAATIRLIKRMRGEIVGIALIGELKSVKGYQKVRGYKKHTLLKFNN